MLNGRTSNIRSFNVPTTMMCAPYYKNIINVFWSAFEMNLDYLRWVGKGA